MEMGLLRQVKAFKPGGSGGENLGALGWVVYLTSRMVDEEGWKMECRTFDYWDSR